MKPPKPASFSLSHKALAWVCALLLALSLLPLLVLSLYNHPFYDDFGFSIKTHAAWRDTGRVEAVLAAAWENTVGIRQTWQGMYTASFISAMQPGLFGEGHYWITTFFLLTAFLLALAFFLWQALRKGLGLDLPSFWIAFAGLAFVTVHFLPDPTEAFFWFNGGVGYAFMYSLALVTMGLWLRLERCRHSGKTALLFGLTLISIVLLGGGSYSMLLFFSLLSLLFVLWAFIQKRPKKWMHLVLLVCLLACFAFSMAAPGNAVRAKTLQGGLSVPMAVAQALYFGLALMGHWFSLPLAGALVLAVALLLPALGRNSFSFAHPLWVTVLAFGLFCAQLAPTLFTGNFLGDGRVLNTYYDTYVLMSLGLTVYWAGFLLRRFPAMQAEPSDRISGPVVAVAAVLLLVGSLAYQAPGSPNYGPQDMTGGSAALSLLRGEARQYDREMDARDAAMNDPGSRDVTLTPVSVIPKVFMSDAASSQAIDYVLSLYAEYYQKDSVTPAGEE